MAAERRGCHSRHRQRHSASATSDVEDPPSLCVHIWGWDMLCGRRVLGNFESDPVKDRKNLQIEEYCATCLARRQCCGGRVVTASQNVVPRIDSEVVLEVECQNLEAHGWLVECEMTSSEAREGLVFRCTLRSARCLGIVVMARLRSPTARSGIVYKLCSCRCQIVVDTSIGWGEIEKVKENRPLHL
jgi:hypothetical protein